MDDEQTLYQRFAEFVAAARDDLLDSSLESHRLPDQLGRFFTVDRDRFRQFWGRVGSNETLRQRWIERLERGYAEEKKRVKAAVEAISKDRRAHNVRNPLDREAA